MYSTLKRRPAAAEGACRKPAAAEGARKKLTLQKWTGNFAKARVGNLARSSGQDLCPSRQSEEPVFYDPAEWLEEVSGQPRQPMPWTLPPTDCPPVEQHPWANHIINLLIAKGFLPAQAAVSLELTVWSDCSGINSEMFSLGDLGAAMFSLMKLQVVWNLYFTCEQDQKCLELAKLNHKPRHFSIAMEERCFKTGKFWCDSCEENHVMPTSGVDIYIGTFPCSPWTRRGKRTGMEHPDAKCLLIGVDTIILLAPAVFIIELGEMPASSGKAEAMSVINCINSKRGRATYIIHNLKENISPSWGGTAWAGAVSS